MLTEEEDILNRWKEYIEELMNVENARERRDDEGPSVQEIVEEGSEEEVKKALKKIKTGKAVGPDNIPAEVWNCLGKIGVKYLRSLFNNLLAGDKMPEEWRSNLVPIFKNKGDVQCCGNYSGIKLSSHTMKL